MGIELNSKNLDRSLQTVGWNNQNVDPSQISRRMMFHANQVVLDDQKQGRSSTPIQILTRAYDHTLADATVDAGSTTCCILKLVEDENHQPSTTIT